MAVHGDKPGLEEERPYVILTLAGVPLEEEFNVVDSKFVFVGDEEACFTELDNYFK